MPDDCKEEKVESAVNTMITTAEYFVLIILLSQFQSSKGESGKSTGTLLLQ